MRDAHIPVPQLLASSLPYTRGTRFSRETTAVHTLLLLPLTLDGAPHPHPKMISLGMRLRKYEYSLCKDEALSSNPHHLCLRRQACTPRGLILCTLISRK